MAYIFGLHNDDDLYSVVLTFIIFAFLLIAFLAMPFIFMAFIVIYSYGLYDRWGGTCCADMCALKTATSRLRSPRHGHESLLGGAAVASRKAPAERRLLYAWTAPMTRPTPTAERAAHLGWRGALATLPRWLLCRSGWLVPRWLVCDISQCSMFGSCSILMMAAY